MTADTTLNLRGPAPLKEQLVMLANARGMTLSKYIVNILDGHVVSLGGRSSLPGSEPEPVLSTQFVMNQVVDDLVSIYSRYHERGVSDVIARRHLEVDIAGYAKRGMVLSAEDSARLDERITAVNEGRD